MAEILHKLNRVALAEHLNRGGQFLLLDPFILVPFVVGLEALPGEHSSEEVHGDVADALHVVSAGLLNTQVSVDGGIPGSSGQVLSFSVRNMLSISLNIPLGQSKVNDKNFMTHFIEADTKVIRFYVAMQKMSIVDVFDSGDHLVYYHQHGLQGKFSERIFEQIL